ncbi:ATP-dependent DNA helicase UvrD/PcrA [Methanosarcina lacustris Z-7289]|uniref:ATP-dependent DNA helicase UvrD/PcrA n=1 Tax=Methanosarcina lacustris Z-7289 TaxID=1434111 RepID=A0A0E3S4I3_9EURY|nr:UvrD-helicase domain-containing protein [Methanosarcina lacustris]AKB75166.1 ATP-dependent DNA helicase UvrD/PcrA [Methanosarcina lacustris Z-7289]
MIEISDGDIEYAEKIFLPEGCSFDSERKTVIKCMESKDIQACPGSGKTTTLLAKLAILAKKMPLEDNKGVCVLTHTNVAINEIKGKLGKKGDILFSYPNYFGTIQSFVDRYLAIPSCLYYYGTRPSKIDSSSYDFEMNNIYNKVPYQSPLKKWLYASSKYKGIKPHELFLRIRIDFVNGKIKDDINATKALLSDTKNEKYVELFSIKESLFKQGILHYDDAYSLAFRYLNEFGEFITKPLSERFAFVFIDEMQDTDEHQNRLITQIFDESKVVIQRFGDTNQSIYDNYVRENSVWEIGEDSLQINGSKRFSNKIADIVKRLCLHEQDLLGNSLVQEIQPKILVFNDETIGSVIPFFGRIINECNLCEEKKEFKAIGWVAKEKEGKRTLPSYFPEFQKKSHHNKIESDFLCEYLQRIDDNTIKIYGANYYRQLMVNSLLKTLRLLEIKNPDNLHNFTEKSLIEYFEKEDKTFMDNFEAKVVKWCLKIHSGTNISEEFANVIRTDFCSNFDGVNIDKLRDFFNNSIHGREEQSRETNIYGGADFNIEVATVHSIKGETHTATLYLETYYRDYDVGRLIKYLAEGNGNPNSVHNMSLKVAYVGMTRPTCLLCVAAHENSISGYEEFLREAGWEIREVRNE